MDILGQYLERPAAPATADWQDRRQAAEQRLPAFDTWLRRELAARIDWTWAGDQPAQLRRIEQARIYLERLVLNLWRRGWMLDGRELAAHLTGCLDSIGRYQKAGKIESFWPYFTATVDRYVGQNAETLRDQSLRVGTHIAQLTNLLAKAAPAAGPTLPELLATRADEVTTAKAETLRTKLARQRAEQAARKADAQQPQLF